MAEATYIETKYEVLVRKVAKMRMYTELWLKTRGSSDRNSMLRYQREVDDILKEEKKIKESGQKELF